MKRCIKCGYESKEEMDKFCKNCGFELNSNYCTNEFCYQRNNGGQIPCDDDACYCPDCGFETRYFADGLISPKTYNP